MYDISAHHDWECLKSVANLESEASGIEQLIRHGMDFIDEENECAYIADIGGEDGTVYGVMVAQLDCEVMDEDDDPISWALENVPAPGTGVPNRMGFLSVEEAAEEIASRLYEFSYVPGSGL